MADDLWTRHRISPYTGRRTRTRITDTYVRGNAVYAARYHHLTTRETNKLTATQAQTVIAAAILRQLHAVITTGQAWDPHVAPHGATGRRQLALAA